MSAFYVGHKSLSMLTDIISRYLVTGYNGFGFEFPGSVVDYFNGKTDEEIFAELRQMNVDALHERYDDAEDMYDDLGYEDGHDIWEPREMEIKQWHYQLLKSLQCYIYQCSEGKVTDRELYKAIDEMSVRVGMFIAMHHPEYEEADWR